MEQRRLGRTEHMSSLVIFGAAALWEASQESADRALNMAMEAGINHIDVAPQYGQAEDRVGNWLPPYREQFFLGCKTQERGREKAWQELHRSLEKLQSDHVDLHQLHAITSFEELHSAMQPGGAIEALRQARDEGLTRYIGITGHGLLAPAIQAQALEQFDFDTVMFPIYPALYALPDYVRDAERLLHLCIEKDVGVMIIKSAAKAPWHDQPKTHSTWYQPHDQLPQLMEGIHFALSQPGVTAVPAAGDVNLLPMIIEAAQQFRPMDASEQARLIEAARVDEPIFPIPES